MIVAASTANKISFSSYQIFVICILGLTQFSVVLDFMIMSPLGDVLMKSINLTTTEFGFAVSAYAFSAGVSAFLTAGFADMFDRKKLLLFFYTGFIVGTLLCGVSYSYISLLFARVITGVFGGVMSSISMAIITDLFALEQRGRVMGFLQMGLGASQVLGIPCGLFLSNVWGWHSPFFMIVMLAICIWIVVSIKLKPITEHLKIKKTHNPLVHFRQTFVNVNYRIGFFTTGLLSIGGFLMMPWGSAFAINNLKVTEGQLPFLFMAAGVTSLIMMPIIGKMSDRFDKFTIFAIASVWMAGVVVLYTNLKPVPLFLVIIVNAMLFIGIIGRMIPSMALVSALPKLEDRGAFMSINSSLQQIAGGVAASIGGFVVHQKSKFSPLENYNRLGYIVVVISMICIFLLYKMNKQVISQRELVPEEPIPNLECL